MIIRFWLIGGLLLGALSWVLLVPLSPAPHQASPGSSAKAYRAAGLLPKVGELEMSTRVGHEVFEVPETDAAHMREAMAAMGGMTGMTMSAPAGDEHAENESGMAMKPAEGEPAEKAMSMGEPAEGGHGGGGGLMIMGPKMAAMAARTIEIEMGEWGFSPSKIMVKPGEVLTFRVRNTGKLPHEFMFMPPAGMAAVNYRLERADWNLSEHESLFEKAVVLPGDGFEVVVKVQEAGSWMFMCMFPYHMQFGMMGTMMTEGAPVMDMGGMKM
jgi:uncharacterized cupredoxin-like copper-binding protein